MLWCTMWLISMTGKKKRSKFHLNRRYAEKSFLESSPRRKNTAKAKLFFHNVKSGRCISFMHTSLRNTWYCLCWVQGVLCILWNYFCMSGSLFSVFIFILCSIRHHRCLWGMAKIEWWITFFTFLHSFIHFSWGGYFIYCFEYSHRGQVLILM